MMDNLTGRITYERLPYLLGDRDVLELFLAQLLGQTVTLCRPPEKALPWYNIHCIPDIRAVGEDGSIFCVFIGPCGMGDLMSEMQADARHGEGVPRELHIVMFCREEPFGGGQSYYKVRPAILNSSIVNSPSVTPVEGGNIYYHVLVVSPSDLFPSAPGEIQQLLEVLGGREPEGEEPGGESLPLLQAMAEVDLRWIWLDNLRRLKKEAFARAYSRNISDGFDHFSSAELGSVAEDAFEEGYIEERLKHINTIPYKAKGTLSVEAIAESLEVPVEVVKGVLEGQQYTEEDFRRLYGRGR